MDWKTGGPKVPESEVIIKNGLIDDLNRTVGNGWLKGESETESLSHSSWLRPWIWYHPTKHLRPNLTYLFSILTLFLSLFVLLGTQLYTHTSSVFGYKHFSMWRVVTERCLWTGGVVTLLYLKRVGYDVHNRLIRKKNRSRLMINFYDFPRHNKL